MIIENNGTVVLDYKVAETPNRSRGYFGDVIDAYDDTILVCDTKVNTVYVYEGGVEAAQLTDVGDVRCIKHSNTHVFIFSGTDVYKLIKGSWADSPEQITLPETLYNYGIGTVVTPDGSKTYIGDCRYDSDNATDVGRVIVFDADFNVLTTLYTNEDVDYTSFGYSVSYSDGKLLVTNKYQGNHTDKYFAEVFDTSDDSLNQVIRVDTIRNDASMVDTFGDTFGGSAIGTVNSATSIAVLLPRCDGAINGNIVVSITLTGNGETDYVLKGFVHPYEGDVSSYDLMHTIASGEGFTYVGEETRYYSAKNPSGNTLYSAGVVKAFDDKCSLVDIFHPSKGVITGAGRFGEESLVVTGNSIVTGARYQTPDSAGHYVGTVYKFKNTEVPTVNRTVYGDTKVSSGETLNVDTTLQAVTVTLPEKGSVTLLDVKGTFGTNTCTIARNGSLIMGLEEDLVIDVDNYNVELVYIDGDWRIV